MGYRSQVTVALYEDDYKRMIKAALEHEKKDYIIDLLNWAQLYQSSPCGESIILLLWSGVKWYDGYDDVDFIMDFLREDDEMPYSFCRVGEEVEDIETECNNDENWILGSLAYPQSYIYIDSDNQLDSKEYLQEEIKNIENVSEEEFDESPIQENDLLQVINM